MLIRNTKGNEFHIVDPDAEKQEKYYVCLCGARVEKNCLHKQTGADGSYTRCYECRKVENARLKASFGQVPPSDGGSALQEIPIGCKFQQ